MSRIIDIHTHAFTDDLAPKALSALANSVEPPAPHFYDGTIEGLITAMDRTGVDISVIQPVATKPSQVPTINDWAAAQISDRIVAFGAMHPDLTHPAEEMARMRRLGLRGFKLHPNYQQFAPHEARLRAVYEAAIDHDMIVLFHAGVDIGVPGVPGTPQSFAAALDAFPGLTAVLAHLGGFREWQAVSEHIAGRDVWLDMAYTMGHLPDEEFVDLVRSHGVDRVLFGSDGPWTDAAAEIAHLRDLNFTQMELDGILGRNAERLLDL